MKALHVIPSIAARYGGPSLAVLEICRGLARAGVETTVVTTDADGNGRLAVPLGRETTLDGVRTIYFRRLWSEAWKLSFSLSRWMRRNVGRFDLVHVHAVFSHASRAAAAISRSAGRPYIVRPLGSLDRWSLDQKPYRKRVFLSAGGRCLLEDAAGLHFTSEAEMNEAAAAIDVTRGFVVPLSVPTRDPMEASSVRLKTIVFLGRIHPKKRIDLLIKAFAELRGRIGLGSWKLEIAGDGEPGHRAHLDALADALGVTDAIEWRGWVGSDEKLELLSRAGLFVLLSETENFGLAVAEAMAAGTPVLVSRGVALSADVRRAGGGWVVDLGEPSWIGTLAEALANEAERLERGRRARAWACREWASEVTTARLVSAYERAVGSGFVQGVGATA